LAVNRDMHYIGCFKQGLKEASDRADRRPAGSREFHNEGAAVEKARDAKYFSGQHIENAH